MIEKKKTELYQELGLQARDLRFQHVMSIATRNNRIIMRMEVMVSLSCKPCFILALWFSCTARKQQLSVTCTPAVNVSLELCLAVRVWVHQLYTLVTIFLVEHRRNITNVTEVKACEEPLLSPWHSAVPKPLGSSHEILLFSYLKWHLKIVFIKAQIIKCATELWKVFSKFFSDSLHVLSFSVLEGCHNTRVSSDTRLS